MITYNDIYEAARRERTNEKQLQELSKNFVQEVAEYLRDKREVSAKDDGEFSEVIIKTKKQLENAQTLFKELMRKRRKKILDLVAIAAETGISKKDFDNMLDFEKELFEELMKSIDISDKKISESLNGNGKNHRKEVVFKEDVDEFMDFDGNMLGPFKKDDKIELPSEIAKILIEDGKAYEAYGEI